MLEPTSEEWQEAAAEAIDAAAQRGGMFTCEELEAWVGEPPNRNGWLIAINRAAHGGVITKTEFAVRSRKPSRKGSYVGIYRGVTEEDES